MITSLINFLEEQGDGSTVFTNFVPWWGILIIVLGGLAIIMIYPSIIAWRKRKNKKPDDQETIKQIGTGSNSKRATPEKDSRNTPYMGIYNWFGKKQALRTTVTVYVAEQEDPCPLCRPFEGKVISLEEYGQNITTMNEAIQQGYHHVGCRHIDLDYFHGSTVIPEMKYSKEHKQTRYALRLKQYKLEDEVREFKYVLDKADAEDQEALLKQLKAKQRELEKFCKDNDLQRDESRENIDISDAKKFE